VLLTAAAACGTRLPDSAFPSRSPSPSASPAAPIPSTSTTPTAGATDVGVTATSVTIGNISSISNVFDPRAFTGGYHGAKAWFDRLNAQGGVNGRKVNLVTCDDKATATGNVQCVESLVGKVFAFASNTILTYAGAPIVDKAGVPDVGGQPIDVAYARYPHLWDVYGESYPRDGTHVGFNGVLTGGTEVWRYFAERFPSVPHKAGVVYYNQTDSQKYGESIAAGLRLEGFQVVTRQVNFALPDYDSAVIAMRRAGVQFVFDALDRLGGQRLCVAMDQNRLDVTAKVTTTQGWVASVKTDYAGSSRCRNDLWATGTALNYDDRDKPQVAAFRDAMKAEGWDTPETMSEWALEGWAGAMWLTDAMRACGTDLTRRCIETFLSRPQPFDGGGLVLPRGFTRQSAPSTTSHNCLNVVRWQDSADSGRGGWVTQVEDMTRNCFDTKVLKYRP
jgi:ABC-type branched-subunit amino acid transport system substrate-binding protein